MGSGSQTESRRPSSLLSTSAHASICSAGVSAPKVWFTAKMPVKSYGSTTGSAPCALGMYKRSPRSSATSRGTFGTDDPAGNAQGFAANAAPLK